MIGWMLQVPAATTLTVWVMFAAPATVTLQVRPHGSGPWQTAMVTATDDTLGHTAILKAVGLSAEAHYDYRLFDGAVEVASSSTWTMPNTGEFVVYNLSDTHGNNDEAYALALADWQENYEPQGIPAFIAQTGDIYNDTLQTIEQAAIDRMVAELPEIQPTVARLPIAFMFDDHDWAGNNSSHDFLPNFLSEPDPHAAALEVYDTFWRGQPRHAPPSLGYALDIADVPFLFLDGRSQRAPQTNLNPLVDGTTGAPGNSISAWSASQLSWLQSEAASYSTRGAMVLVTGTTFSDPLGPYVLPFPITPLRDSIGIWSRPERNAALGTLGAHGLGSKLVVWSGDDHRNSVFTGRAGEAVAYDQNSGPSIGVAFHEFKVMSGSTQPVGNALAVWGPGDRFEWSGTNHACIARWAFDSWAHGRHVAADIAYLHVGGQIPEGGAFHYQDGALSGQ